MFFAKCLYFGLQFSNFTFKTLEVEFDDLCEAENILNEYWDHHENEVEGNQEFKKELETFDDRLSSVKQIYIDFISLVLDRSVANCIV